MKSKPYQKLIACLVLLTFLATGLMEELSGIDFKKAFAAELPAGSINGEMNVGDLKNSANTNQSFHTDLFTGRGQTSVPIFTPPGRRGLTPQTVLSYSSSGGNSWLGVGWGLDHGFIQRSTKKGVPTYNNDQDAFTFLIQGVNSDLVKISGNEYHAKDESGEFLKFIFENNAWMVYDKSGTEYTFGEDDSHRMTNSRGIFCWCLEKVKDVYGNTIHYTYTMDQGEMYLSRIDYNGNEEQSFNDTHSVEFILEDRTDIAFSYMTGAKVTTAKRLKTIQTKVMGYLSRKYNLTYEQSPNVGRSRLISIQECGTDGTTCLPATTFTYQNQTPGFQSGVTWIQPNTTLRTVSLGNSIETVSTDDINGDGLPDRIKKNSDNTWTVYFNTSSGFSASGINWGPIQGYQDTNWAAIRADTNGTSSYVNLMDLNGDGLLDRVIKGYSGNVGGSSGWAVQYNTGIGFANQVYFGPTTESQDIRSGEWYHPDGADPDTYRGTWDTMDMNGDGYLDHVYTIDYSNWGVYWGSATGFSSSRYTWSNIQGAVLRNSLRDFDACQGNGYADVFDINGDDLPDRILPGYGGNPGGYTGFAVQFNNGLNFENMQYFGPVSAGTYSQVIKNWEGSDDNHPNTVWALIDVNQDGLLDRVRKIFHSNSPWEVYFNTGNGFSQSPVSWGPLEGYSDSDRAIKRSESDSVTVEYSDINGDGFPDRVVSHSSSAQWLVQLAYSTVPDLLSTMNNGRGGVTTVEYKPSTQYDNRDTAGVYRLPFPVNVVSKVTQNDGMGNSVVTNYSYKGGMYDAPTREFRGFRETTVTDAVGTQSIHTFLQDEHAKGRPLSIEVKDSLGNTFSKEMNTWECNDTLFPGVHFVHLAETNSYLYDGNSTFKQIRKRFDYDTFGNLVIAYDDGDPNTTTDDKRSENQYVLNESLHILGAVAITSVYDSQNQKINEKYFYYDQHVNLTDPPEKGMLTKSEDWVASGTPPALTMTYDSFGNVATVRDARNYLTQNEYDTTLHLFVVRVTNALGHTQEFIYDPVLAQITETHDQNGQVSRTIYDALGRPIKVISVYDSESAPTKAVIYDDTTFPNRAIAYEKISYDAPALVMNGNPQTGYRTSYTFMDGLGREIQKRTPAEDEAHQVVSGNVTFDNRGQIARQYVSYFADFRSTYASVITETPFAENAYDAAGRKIRINFPDATFSTVEYDDYVKTVTDANGHSKRYTNDSYGNLAKVEEFNNGETYTTLYQYDALNRLVATADHYGRTTGVTYDVLGRKTGMTDPNMGVWTYTYDANNNLLTQTDAKQQTITFVYDELNRLVRKDYPDQTHVTYTYDSCLPATCGGLEGENYGLGRLLKVEDASGVQTFRYDKLGRVVQDQKTAGDGQFYSFTRLYDALGRVNTLEYPDGEILTMVFNSMNDVEQMTLVVGETQVPIITSVDYNASNQITRLVYGNGVATDYTYNPQTLRLQDLVTHGASNVTLQNFHYEFDNVGNVNSITDSVHSNTQSFLYDSLDRLTQATGSYGVHPFQYDAIGNMIQKADAAIHYDDPLHPQAATSFVSPSESIQYSYDANGNMVARGREVLTYDYDNRIKKIERIGPREQTIHLSAGWNEFTLPFAAFDPGTGEPISNIEDIFQELSLGADYDQVSLNENDQWTHFVADPEFSDFITLELAKTYRIFVTNPDGVNVTIHGDPAQIETTTIGEYQYDASGARTKKLASGKTTYYLGKDFEIEYSSLTQLTRKAFFLGETRIAERELTDSGIPHMRFFHQDHLGSTNVITNGSGAETLLMEYLPYGEVKVRLGSDPVQNTFTGQKEDLESSLMYYNARYYDPKIGRFITADSIVASPANPQSFNRYSYVDNNPIRFTDPTGHKKKKRWSWKGFFAFGVVGGLLGATKAGAYLGAMLGIALAPVTAGQSLWLSVAIMAAAGAAGGALGGGIGSSIDGNGFRGAANGAINGAIMGATAGLTSGAGGGVGGPGGNGGGAGAGLPAGAQFVDATRGAVDGIFTGSTVSSLVSSPKSASIINAIIGMPLAYAAESGSPSKGAKPSSMQNIISVQSNVTIGPVSFQTGISAGNAAYGGLISGVAGGIPSTETFGTFPPQFGAGLEIGMFSPESEEVIASPYFGIGKHLSLGTNIVDGGKLIQGLNINIGASTSVSRLSMDVPLSRISQSVKQFRNLKR